MREHFDELGIDFYGGVPCSEIKQFLSTLKNEQAFRHVMATREDEAIGIAVGAWLGGRTPLVYMQNSGLGNSVNAISSLLVPYDIKINLLITTHRGAEHQEHTYKTTPNIINALKYDAYTFYAYKDVIEKDAQVEKVLGGKDKFKMQSSRSGLCHMLQDKPWTREEGIRNIVSSYNDTNTVFIATNGLISRELCNIQKDRSFFMAGSMGLAPAIGLGLALTRPDLHVVVINGDGSYLMGLGVNATIANYAPENFKHFVFVNNMHETTGGQPLVELPILKHVDFLRIIPGGPVPPRIDIPLQYISYKLRSVLTGC